MPGEPPEQPIVPALSDAFRSAGIPVLQGLIGSGLFLEGLVCGLTLPDVPVSLQSVVASLCGSCLNRFCLCLSLPCLVKTLPAHRGELGDEELLWA